MYHDSDDTWKPIFDDWFKIIKEIRSLETPLNPREGQLWINDEGIMYWFNGTKFVPIKTAMANSIDFDTNSFQNFLVLDSLKMTGGYIVDTLTKLISISGNLEEWKPNHNYNIDNLFYYNYGTLETPNIKFFECIKNFTSSNDFKLDIPYIIYEGDEEGYRDALVRHVEFFNVTPQLAPFIGGVVTSMEEMKARGEVDGEAIASIKTALMGPLSGIGDSIFVGCLRVIAVGIGISLAQAGNIMGPILYFLLYNIPCFIVRYFGAHFGYNLGFNYLQKMQENGMMDKLLSAASILGVMVVGCMSKDMVWTTLNVELSRIGDDVTTLQSILDGIMPGLIGLGGTWLYYFLLKKKVNPVILIFGTMIIGVIGAYFGVLAG